MLHTCADQSLIRTITYSTTALAVIFNMHYVVAIKFLLVTMSYVSIKIVAGLVYILVFVSNTL